MTFFPTYEPPPDGLTRLRSRLDASTRSRAFWLIPVAVAALLGFVFFSMLPRAETLKSQITPSPDAYALGLLPAPDDQLVLSSSHPVVALSGPGAAVQVFAVMGDP